jgi:hypothetical protein
VSIEAIRSAFMAAGKGVLTHAGLAYKDSHQVLTFPACMSRICSVVAQVSPIALARTIVCSVLR